MKSHVFSMTAAVLLTACNSSSDDASVPAPVPPPIIPGLSITAPETREDGSGISMAEIASLRLYYGTVDGDYQKQMDLDPVDPVIDFSEFTPGTTYFSVVTTVDTKGRESIYSEMVEISL